MPSSSSRSDASKSVSPRGGIVRIARRPPGWIAPGPAPVGPGDDAMLWPGPGEDLCFLVGDFRIFQLTVGHRWSLDDLVTADLARRALAAPPARFLDLGCGLGSVLMSVAWLYPEAHGVGIEAQPISAALCRRALRYNGLAGRVALHEGDLRDPAHLAGAGSFDLITGTPPYFPSGTGVESPEAQRGDCRFEHRGGVEAYLAAAAAALAPQGRFVLCTAHGQAERVATAAAELDLCIEAGLDIVPRAGKPPLLALAVLRRTAAQASSPLPAHDQLTVRDEHGQWTPRFLGVRAAMGLPPRLA